ARRRPLRAQRRVRGAGGRRDRRGDGGADAGRRVPGEVRGGLGPGGRAQRPGVPAVDRPLRTLLLLSLVLAGAACAGAASAQTDGSIQGTGSNPACRAAELKALFRGFQAAGGSLTGAVVLVNTGRAPC